MDGLELASGTETAQEYKKLIILSRDILIDIPYRHRRVMGNRNYALGSDESERRKNAGAIFGAKTAQTTA